MKVVLSLVAQPLMVFYVRCGNKLFAPFFWHQNFLQNWMRRMM